MNSTNRSKYRVQLGTVSRFGRDKVLFCLSVYLSTCLSKLTKNSRHIVRQIGVKKQQLELVGEWQLEAGKRPRVRKQKPETSIYIDNINPLVLVPQARKEGVANTYQMLVLQGIRAILQVSSASRCGCQRCTSHLTVEFSKVLPVVSQLRHHGVTESQGCISQFFLHLCQLGKPKGISRQPFFP